MSVRLRCVNSRAQSHSGQNAQTSSGRAAASRQSAAPCERGEPRATEEGDHLGQQPKVTQGRRDDEGRIGRRAAA